VNVLGVKDLLCGPCGKLKIRMNEPIWLIIGVVNLITAYLMMSIGYFIPAVLFFIAFIFNLLAATA
jgi:hypothetical protein